MNALINIYGYGGDMEIIPTIPRKFQSLDSDMEGAGVNLESLRDFGFDCFINMDVSCRKIKIPYSAGGSDVCIQVRKKHIFQKVKITSNVPIYSFCEIGFLKSVFVVFCDFYSSIKEKKNND